MPEIGEKLTNLIEKKDAKPNNFRAFFYKFSFAEINPQIRLRPCAG